MKIAIDARWIFQDISGIGNYTRQLLREITADPGSHTYQVLFSDPRIAERTSLETGMQQAPHMETAMIPWNVFSVKSQLCLPRYLHAAKVRVFHSPNYMIPFLAFNRKANGPIRAVTTIHDLIPLRFPDHAPRSRKSRMLPLFRAILKESALRSSRIATVSHVSAHDIAKYLGAPGEKIQVIHNGVSPDFRPAAQPGSPQPLEQDKLELLYVGRSDPYKNIIQLIKVLEVLRRQHIQQATLTIVGAPDSRYPEPQQLVEACNLQEAVRWTGFVGDQELRQHIQTADIMLHASRYEGFGLQIIEAMACGIPVVCSNTGSLPEVAGGAAILVDPDDTMGFVDGILRLRNNPGERALRIEAGLANAARFSWQQAAAATRTCYEEAAS